MRTHALTASESWGLSTESFIIACWLWKIHALALQNISACRNVQIVSETGLLKNDATQAFPAPTNLLPGEPPLFQGLHWDFKGAFVESCTTHCWPTSDSSSLQGRTSVSRQPTVRIQWPSKHPHLCCNVSDLLNLCPFKTPFLTGLSTTQQTFVASKRENNNSSVFRSFQLRKMRSNAKRVWHILMNDAMLHCLLLSASELIHHKLTGNTTNLYTEW